MNDTPVPGDGARPELERSYRRLLRAFPEPYRRARADEMLAVLLDSAPPGQRRARPAEVVDLLRAGAHQRLRPRPPLPPAPAASPPPQAPPPPARVSRSRVWRGRHPVATTGITLAGCILLYEAMFRLAGGPVPTGLATVPLFLALYTYYTVRPRPLAGRLISAVVVAAADVAAWCLLADPDRRTLVIAAGLTAGLAVATGSLTNRHWERRYRQPLPWHAATTATAP
jgi:hypothetical protein